MEYYSDPFSKSANKIRNLGCELAIVAIELIINPFFVIRLTPIPIYLRNWHKYC